MIDSVLERQAKSTDELLCRLIEERDGKNLMLLKLILLLLLALLVLVKPIHTQVVHRRAALQFLTPLPSQ
jgi:type II secretory pathway component PulM